MKEIKRIIQSSIDVKYKILQDEKLLKIVEEVTQKIIHCFQNKGKVLFCGNGGSAADAQHLAAEFTGRFYSDRDPLYSEALHVNTSYMTAVANDYSYDEVYSRLIKAKGQEGDILIALTTSGNSKNILKAIEQANIQKMITIGMTGETGGKLNELAHIMIKVPSTDTPRIQESHIMLGHIMCELVEKQLFF